MKDYLAYNLMNKMGVASPLCAYVQMNVNGEPWGFYLAVKGVEDALEGVFLSCRTDKTK